jgi:2-polyprenyl-3-methyl-5-hydroxy-6-metoxy-1,4-benzoquinol methylase
MKQLSCPICSGVSYPYYEYKDFFGEPVSLYKCINCGHGSHDRQYTAQQFSEIYRSDYAADYLVKEKSLYLQRQVQYALDVELLLECRKFGAVRVLDYGCSSGGYLDAMPPEWKKSGFEINPFHIQYVLENKKHIKVFDSVAAIGGQFDLITMRGVIEHIPDHTELITFFEQHLAPGGAVFITATPDVSSVCATLYKSKWNQVVCPEHIHQFSPTSLSFLLARAGLVLRSLNHPYMGTPYADWTQDKARFADNFLKLQQDSNADIVPMHAFVGNMMSALYEK